MIDLLGLSVAGWIATLFFTNFFDWTDEKLEKEVIEVGDKLSSKIQEKFPSLKQEIELVAQQPRYERHGALTKEVELAAKEDSEFASVVKKLETLITPLLQLNTYEQNNKFFIEGDKFTFEGKKIIVEGDTKYDLRGSKFGGGFAVRDQYGGTLIVNPPNKGHGEPPPTDSGSGEPPSTSKEKSQAPNGSSSSPLEKSEEKSDTPSPSFTSCLDAEALNKLTTDSSPSFTSCLDLGFLREPQSSSPISPISPVSNPSESPKEELEWLALLDIWGRM